MLGSNAAIEQIFSGTGKVRTSEKNYLKTETLKNI